MSAEAWHRGRLEDILVDAGRSMNTKGSESREPRLPEDFSESLLQVIFTIMCLEWLTTYICKPPEALLSEVPG